MQYTPSYTLLTFYAFIDIADPYQAVKEHKQFCTDIGMKWRVYIGPEGISATMTCNEGQRLAYTNFLSHHPLFHTIEDIDTKATSVPDHQFTKMIVKYRPEIVALWKTVTAEQVKSADKQISIEEFKHIVDHNDQDRAILDMRNDYERQLWHFKGALPAGTVAFKEVPDLLKKYKQALHNKKVVMYCTGGIRCEKLSVLLKEEWLENFYALNGGVVKYTNTYNDGNREGNLYTFDGRVSCAVGDDATHTAIATCIYTGKQTDACENCRYSPCNARIIADPQAYRKHMGFCSSACVEAAKKDILIKNADRDSIDYKTLRSLIKQDPTQREAIIANVAHHLTKKLLHVSFPHSEPQKEKVLHTR